MAEVIPFRAWRYNPELVGDVASVTAPPYDVISPRMQDELLARHPNNIVRLILRKDDEAEGNKYFAAGSELRQWCEQKILARDDTPAIYVMEHEYVHRNGETKTRVGFTVLARIGADILGHEKTFAAPTEDRLNLVRECRANLSPIFSLYADPLGKIAAILESERLSEPAMVFASPEGVTARMWPLRDRARIETVQEYMADHKVFIADGHHRCETAGLYRDERRAAEGTNPEDVRSYDYVMMYFARFEDPGLAIYPCHRVLTGVLEGFDPEQYIEAVHADFAIEPVAEGSPRDRAAEELVRRLEELEDATHAYGLVMKDRPLYLLTRREHVRPRVGNEHCQEWYLLDVSVLHELLLGKHLGLHNEVGKPVPVEYTPNEQDAIAKVDDGQATLAFLVNPTKATQVATIARARDRMPHKSTYFHPKLLSGLLINTLE